MSLPTSMRALTFHTQGSVSVETIPLPPLRPTHLLIKVDAVALNPTDWKCAYHCTPASPFSIVGCDFAGTVVSIGSAVTKPFKIGDKVYGCAHGSNESQSYDGVFAEYAVVKGDVVMHAPSPSSPASKLSLEDLSTIGLGSITVGQGLFQSGKGFGLPLPEEGKGAGEWVLICGGSTATGSLAIQFMKLAGYKVATTCSPKNFDFVRSRGADEVLDYKDPECGAKIRELTGNKLRYAWDTVGESAKVCEAALGEGEGRYGTILYNDDFTREGVKQTMTLMYTMFGESFRKYDMEFPASEEDWEFAKRWMGLTERLVGEGKVRPHPKRVGSGGLEGILAGLEELKEERVSGEKLVYRI